MSKKMLINASHPEENRVGIVVDGILSELDIELSEQQLTRGNIYKAVVARVETGLQAAFIDYGEDKPGFLQISEIHPNLYPGKNGGKGRPRIADILRRGQEILIQVVKEERGNKGAALTTFLSLPGRYMVLMPDSTTKGVSRKITEEAQRKTLKKTMEELNLPQQMGYIVRTAGIGKDKDELKRDFDYLVRLYEGIVSRKDQVKAPAQLYQESNLIIRSIRDYFSIDMDEVLVDDERVYQDAKDFFALVMPEHAHLVKLHRERRPIFSRYQIEEQIDALSKNQIPLASGGSIVIDPTEALVAIDVNSGKMSGESGIEATALRTNLEAATEIGRQLRLRDLGGLIVVDFIDMRERKHIREVEQELRKALKNDKAKVSVGKISQFGLLEMSRQRIKAVLSVGHYRPCPHCQGIGRIKSIEAQAVNFLRQAHTAAAKGQISHLEARVPYDVANHLLNQKRATIGQLEQELGLKIAIFGRTDLLPGELELETFKREAVTTKSEDAPVTHANQIESALAEAKENDDQPQTESSQEASVIQNGSTSEQEASQQQDAPKKRRRRRRRKPAKTEATETVDTPHNAPEVEKPAAQAQEAESAGSKAESQDIATIEKTTETTDQETIPAAEKPKRARRPRKTPVKKTGTAEATGAGETSDQIDQQKTKPQEEAGVPATQPDGADTQTAASTEKPKRARRPRKTPVKKAGTAEATGAGETSDQTDQQKTKPQDEAGVPATQPDGADKQTAASTEKPKRPRRPRKAPVKKTDTAEATGAGETSDQIDQQQTKPQEKGAVPATQPDGADTQTTAPAEKPKRPRRPRKAPVKKSEMTATSEPETKTLPDKIAENTDNMEKSEEKAPVKRPRRPRSTPAKKKTAEPATTERAPVPATDDSSSES